MKKRTRQWRVAKCLGRTPKEGLLGEINAGAPNRDKKDDGAIGDASHSSRTSDHNPNHDGVVCARDFTHDPEGGFDANEFAKWLAKRCQDGQEVRVKYIISEGQIASGPGQGKPVGIWRVYRGSNPHTEHVHVSVRGVAKYYDDTKTWGWLGRKLIDILPEVRG